MPGGVDVDVIGVVIVLAAQVGGIHDAAVSRKFHGKPVPGVSSVSRLQGVGDREVGRRGFSGNIHGAGHVHGHGETVVAAAAAEPGPVEYFLAVGRYFQQKCVPVFSRPARCRTRAEGEIIGVGHACHINVAVCIQRDAVGPVVSAAANPVGEKNLAGIGGKLDEESVPSAAAQPAIRGFDRRKIG